MNLPIFPLNIFLLPDGVTRLRIFEQRYLNMVKNAQQTNGFVICYCQNSPTGAIESQIEPWGSWVEIVNFMQGSDGILVIDVKCKALVDIHATSINFEQLMFGDVEIRQHWADNLAQQSQSKLSMQLKNIFFNNKELADLYQQNFCDDNHWICARWLELLPLPFADKSIFISQDSFDKAVKFLTDIISAETI